MGLYSKVQASQGYRVRPYLKTQQERSLALTQPPSSCQSRSSTASSRLNGIIPACEARPSLFDFLQTAAGQPCSGGKRCAADGPGCGSSELPLATLQSRAVRAFPFPTGPAPAGHRNAGKRSSRAYRPKEALTHSRWPDHLEGPYAL